MSTRLDTVYATDEDLAVRVGNDFPILVPPWSMLGAAKDGVFSAIDPWLLTSDTVDFEAAGVMPGCVLKADAPKLNFPAGGELFAIDTVLGHSITLRRIGFTSGMGKLPVEAGELIGVGFSIPTLIPEIEEASFQINRRYGIDANFDLRAPDMVYDLRDLRQLVVLEVLEKQFNEMSRQSDDDFAVKGKKISADANDLRGRVSIRWGPLGDTDGPTNIFGKRVIR